MDKPLIILESLAHDVHAHAVAWGLRESGARFALLFSANMPSRSTVTLRFSDPLRPTLRYSGPEAEIEIGHDDHVIYWARRLIGPQNPAGLDPADASVARNENRCALNAFREMLRRDSRNVFLNDILAKSVADNKPLQIACAAEVGFSVPETLFSNDKSEILYFARNAGGEVIYKTYTPAVWRQKSGKGSRNFMVYSSLVSAEAIEASATISFSSGIYQRKIEKDYEVRVTVMGGACFASKLYSQELESTAIDWRAGQSNLRNEAIETPSAVAEKCVKFLRRMGLLFGCFDFIVTPDGKWIFLECNEQGQWLWQESKCPELTILDAFVQFIQAPSLDFRYESAKPRFRFGQYTEEYWRSDDSHAREKNVIVEGGHVNEESPA
jgi:glutathione synthase/RimK-type ligase-like ATP-grasp enzyme